MSRELDAQVAKKVMGWTVEHMNSDPLPPHYSTSISDAWLVVEEVTGRSYEIDLFRGGEGAPWGCNFIMAEDHYFGGYYDTAPEAICRAALEAVRD